MAYTAETIQTHTKIASAWANKIEQELATVGNYLGRVATKGLLNNLSADYKDFAWVDDEQAFYWYAGNGWFPYDVKRLKEGFTLVNLLGSYGGFEKDSNGDGVADGWTLSGNLNSTPSIINGQKIIVDNNDTTAGSSYMIIGVNLQTLHKYFVKTTANIQKLEMNSVLIKLFNSSYASTINAGITEGNTGIFSLYGTETHNISSWYQLWLYAVSSPNLTPNSENIVTFSNVCLYDLTWMDQYSQMPQSLQEKYAVSKWVDMTDNDLANELPYVNSVAYVGVGL